MHLVGAHLSSFAGDRVLRSLLDMRLGDGTWSSSAQGLEGRPEASCYALLALHVWGCRQEVEDSVASFETRFSRTGDPVLWNQTLTLATAVRVFARVAPTSPLLADAAKALEDGAVASAENGALLWPQSLSGAGQAGEPGRVERATVVHSAHAVLALTHAHRATDGRVGLGPDSLLPTARWLLLQEEWENTDELMRGRRDRLFFRHYTLPWVVRALLEAGIEPSEPRIVDGIRTILSGQANGIWIWRTGERPIWATSDGLHALTDYALRGCSV